MPPRTGKPTYGESFLFQPLLIVESGHIVTITIHYLRVSPSSSHIFLYPSHLFPSPLVNSLFPPSPQKLLRSAPRHMMCNHSPRESYSLCEWDHNRPSFAFNSQSDNTLHVHMCVCVCVCVCVFSRLTPRWLHGWAWTDVPTGAELPERAETWTLMRRWQNSHSPIKESEWIPFKTGGLGRMRNDKDIPQGRRWCGVTRAGEAAEFWREWPSAGWNPS